MEKAFCFCDGVTVLSPNVALSICVHLPGVRALWVNPYTAAVGHTLNRHRFDLKIVQLTQMDYPRGLRVYYYCMAAEEQTPQVVIHVSSKLRHSLSFSLCRSRSFLFHFFGARIPSGPMVKSKKQVKMIGRVAENHERQGSRSGSWVLISNKNNADTLRRRPWVCTIIGINFILCFK